MPSGIDQIQTPFYIFQTNTCIFGFRSFSGLMIHRIMDLKIQSRIVETKCNKNPRRMQEADSVLEGILHKRI